MAGETPMIQIRSILICSERQLAINLFAVLFVTNHSVTKKPISCSCGGLVVVVLSCYMRQQRFYVILPKSHLRPCRPSGPSPSPSPQIRHCGGWCEQLYVEGTRPRLL